jgi:hypothetical protein
MDTLPPIVRQTPPPVPVTAQNHNSFAKQAALFSLLAPFVSIGINICGNQAVQGNRVGMFVLGGTCTLLILLGFVFGIVALIGMRKHGTKGILGKALAGVCLNGIILLFALIAIPAFIQTARHTKEMQQQKMEQQSPRP